MSMLVWVMMGIAIWHFAVWVPDYFWGGIVGAFLAALFGAVLFGFAVAGGTVPGQNDTDITQALIAVPGAVNRASRPPGSTVPAPSEAPPRRARSRPPRAQASAPSPGSRRP